MELIQRVQNLRVGWTCRWRPPPACSVLCPCWLAIVCCCDARQLHVDLYFQLPLASSPALMFHLPYRHYYCAVAISRRPTMQRVAVARALPEQAEACLKLAEHRQPARTQTRNCHPHPHMHLPPPIPIPRPRLLGELAFCYLRTADCRLHINRPGYEAPFTVISVRGPAAVRPCNTQRKTRRACLALLFRLCSFSFSFSFIRMCDV